MTIYDLVIWFSIFAALLCLWVLFALASDRRLKMGYAILMASFLGWLWLLLKVAPVDALGGGGWFLVYSLPVVWIVWLCAYAFPKITPFGQWSTTEEPRHTQESLRGRPATREALIFFFIFQFMLLMLMLLLLLKPA